MSCRANLCPMPTSANEEPAQDPDLQADLVDATTFLSGIVAGAPVIRGLPNDLLGGAVAMLRAHLTSNAETKRDLNQLGNGLLAEYLHRLGSGGAK